MLATLKLQDKSIYKELKRKTIHISSLWIPLTLYFLHPSLSFTLFSTLFIGNVALEYGNYKKWPWARFLFGKIFVTTLRSHEISKTQLNHSGSLYVIASAMACSLLFSQTIGTIALTIMLISDSCAALIGKIYGSRKIRGKKTIEGTFAFLLSALIIMVIYNPIYPVSYASIIACICATLAELYEDKLEIDDNLSISLSVGVVLSFIG